MIKLATIGTSAITEQFLKGCALTKRFEHAAVYSRDKERAREFAKTDGCKKVYTDLLKLAEDPEIDACYIASVNSCHFEQSKIMLEHGKHVICEKPIAPSADEYKKLKELADKKGLIYLEAITSYHSEGRKKVLEGIKSVGKISQIRIDFCQRSSRLDRYNRGEHVNVFDMSLNGGALMDLGVYCIYAAIDLFGMPKKINSAVSYLKNGADCSGTLIFEYENKIAAITYSKTGQSKLGSEIIGQNGTLTIGSVSQYTDVKLYCKDKETTLVPDTDKPKIMSGEANDFADYLEKPYETAKSYKKASELSFDVHTIMDKIIKDRDIKY